MLPKVVVLGVLLCLACSFTILQKKNQVKQDWPFKVVSEGDWTVESVDITPRPARGANCSIDVVRVV